MGRCVRREGSNGTPRFLAMYTDANGERRSAGTFDTEDEATEAWQDAEAMVRAGRGNYLTRGRTLFQVYAEELWLPNLTLEATTREGYTLQLYRHIMPTFGDRQLIDIRVPDVKAWLTSLKDAGVKPVSRKRIKALLSSILTSAVDDEYIETNPCLRVKVGTVEQKPLEIISPQQFDIFYQALPDDMSKLLVETAIETGMRWGELTELRVSDFDFDRCAFTVSRTVVHVSPQFHPDGKRFLVKEYPKNGKYRFIKVKPALGENIRAHINRHSLSGDDLLFWYTGKAQVKPAMTSAAEFGHLGFTEPNADGKKFAHGTLSAYTFAKCRCEHCRGAIASYRRKRRAAGKDQPRRQRLWDTDGHIPNRWFREQVIKPALERAGIKVDIRMHLLRHAHASWLLNGGADLMVVKERLGHDSVTTTERYLHTIDNADETALAALDAVRARKSVSTTQVAGPSVAPEAVNSTGMSSSELLLQMAALQMEMAKMIANERGGKDAA